MPPSIDKAEALKRINSVINYVFEESNKIEEEYKNHPEKIKSINDIKLRYASSISLRLQQTIVDLAPSTNKYRQFAEALEDPFTLNSVNALLGAIMGLRADYKDGYLKGFNEMIDAELFSDILEQAEYFLSKGFVRASAVVAGVALESHLRKLAEKNSIPITKDDGSYINADSLNGELRNKEVIDKTINKSITSWLGLRNDAAHPDTTEINEGLIKPMIAGIRVFIQQYPA